MTNLIKLSAAAVGGQQVETVNARELHAYLENGDHFSTWIKDRIEQYNFIENQDFVTFSAPAEKGRPRVEYAVTLDMAKELSMVERNAIQTAQGAGRTVVLEEPSPTCDSDHPRLANYSAVIDAAGESFGVPVIQQFAFIQSVQGWQQHMDGSCTVPDAYLDGLKAQQELAVIAPLVKTLIGS